MLGLAPIQGPYGIQPFDDNGNLLVRLQSDSVAKYDTVCFELTDISGLTGATLEAGSKASGWANAVNLADAGATVPGSPFAVFGVVQQAGDTGDVVTVKVCGFTTMNVTQGTAIVRGTTLEVDVANNDVRDGGGGRAVAVAMEDDANGQVSAYFDGLTYRG